MKRVHIVVSPRAKDDAFGVEFGKAHAPIVATCEDHNMARTSYEAIGGTAGCRRLSTAFYARVEKDPVLRPLFPGKTFTCAIEEFTAFLVQLLGGPSEDTQRRWWVSLHESHMRFKIGACERAAWLMNMMQTFEDVSLAEPIRGELIAFFKMSSAYVVNQGALKEQDDDGSQTEISRRWADQLRRDETVAAIRRGDADRAIALAENAASLNGLLAMMIRSGQDALLRYVNEKLPRQPELVRERFAGRTLLHDAAAAGQLPTVELLLRLGVDPNVRDGGEHTPLYSLANECAVAGACRLVRVLVDAGAGVNANDGAKRCTPLHMAARRDHVDIAEALLECGADIEARDSVGETPLRRAVNCNQVRVAALLLARGADFNSRGSKGGTPLLAARSAAMKKLLHEVASNMPSKAY